MDLMPVLKLNNCIYLNEFIFVFQIRYAFNIFPLHDFTLNLSYQPCSFSQPSHSLRGCQKLGASSHLIARGFLLCVHAFCRLQGPSLRQRPLGLGNHSPCWVTWASFSVTLSLCCCCFSSLNGDKNMYFVVRMKVNVYLSPAQHLACFFLMVGIVMILGLLN